MVHICGRLQSITGGDYALSDSTVLGSSSRVLAECANVLALLL